MDISSIEGRAYELMSEHSWPGNIRKLQNAMERAMIRCKGDTLKASHFGMGKANIPARPRAQELSPYQGSSLSTLKADMEYDAIRKALVQAWGNKTKAAKLLGISRNAFYKKLRKYGDKLDAQ
jgi:Response regulator containing CheY-like receiver, AAA-type ATPase, and DNA-binding domains